MARVAHSGWLLLVAAFGRIGFEPPGLTGGDPVVDGNPGTGTSPSIACADMNLGSTIGAAVATGSTIGTGNRYPGCGGDGNDVTFGWTAPAAGRHVIDLCASSDLWDSVLSIRDGSCTGRQLACSDDVCGGFGAQGRVMVTLAAGQGIVIVVDSAFSGVDGDYQLAITPQ